MLYSILNYFEVFAKCRYFPIIFALETLKSPPGFDM